MARLLLASRGIPGLAHLLGADARAAVLVPTASRELGEPAIADEVERELAGAGLRVERLDIAETAPDETRAGLAGADVIAVSGGDPFYLLAAARRAGFEVALRAALARGAVYVGFSAGAMVAGPTLEPLRLTSPFPAPAGLDLTGLRLSEVLVLPHHNHPGRPERHAAAAAAFAGRVRLEPLADGELVIQDGAQTTVVHGRCSDSIAVTARLRAEIMAPAHRDGLVALLGDPRVGAWLGGVPSADEVDRLIAGTRRDWEQGGLGWCAWLDRATGELVARGGPRRIRLLGREEVEVAWTVAAPRWNQGLATELGAASFELARARGARDAIAFARADNSSSRRVMGKLGFVFERTFAYRGAPHALYRRAFK